MNQLFLRKVGTKYFFTELGLDQTERWLFEGKSYSQISKTLGINPDTLSKMCKEVGIHKDNRVKYTLNERYFETIESKEQAYWLGFLCADGYVSESRGYLAIEIEKTDEPTLMLLNSALESNRPIKSIQQQNGYLPHKRLTINSRKMVNDLIKHGCFQNKSLTLKPPATFNPNLYLYWILGYYDGDGGICYYKSGNAVRYKSYFTGTYEVITFIQKFLGGQGSIRKSHRCQNNTYDLILTEGPTKKYLSQAYDEETIRFCMQRKYKKYKLLINN